MTKHRAWQGIRMRTVEAAADPDAPPRRVTLPAAWEDEAAAALVALVPGTGAVSLTAAAEGWFGPVAARAQRGGLDDNLLADLHALLRTRRGMPDPGTLAGPATPRFVLNLPAFVESEAFDVPGFAAAARAGTLALALARPEATEMAVGFADLDGLLAALGVDYGAPEASTIAAGLAAVVRGEADAVSALLARRFGAAAAPARDLPAPPAETPVPGLAQAAREALGRATGAARRHHRTTGIALPGPAEALLGAEAGGVGPAFGPLGPDGLTRAALARLAAAGLSPQAALARALAGETLFPPPTAAAEARIRQAVSAWIGALPAPAFAPAALAAGAAFEPLPARHTSTTAKVSIGAHRLFLHTGEYADGRVAEVALSAPRETATARALLEAVCAAVSIGLQHGVPLEAYVEAFLLTRFGPAGAVEGDPAVPAATSPLDWMARHLAAQALGRHDLPPADPEPGPAPRAPLLPLDLPAAPRARRRNLRVVA